MTTTITNIPFDIDKDVISFEEFMQLVEEREDRCFEKMIQEGRVGDLVSYDHVMKTLLA